MIPSGVEVYVASTPVDFRKGPVSLMALVRDGGVDPFNGALYVFRSKRADRVKIVWWDGGGICLFAKTLEKEQFCWPRIAPATVRLNYVQRDNEAASGASIKMRMPEAWNAGRA